jgi:hypothetical protein
MQRKLRASGYGILTAAAGTLLTATATQAQVGKPIAGDGMVCTSDIEYVDGERRHLVHVQEGNQARIKEQIIISPDGKANVRPDVLTTILPDGMTLEQALYLDGIIPHPARTKYRTVCRDPNAPTS